MALMTLHLRRRRPLWIWAASFFFLLVSAAPLCCRAFKLGRRDLPQLTVDQIVALVSSPDPTKNVDPSNPVSHISKILIPRVPGTKNNTLVKDYLVSTLKALGWHVEEDNFVDTTPIGAKNFTNVIATHDPSASRRVILAAHFDSKYFPSYPQNQFVGATDSAAPCAMMLDLAEALKPLLDARKQRLEHGMEDDEDVSETTLQLVFFDGEEAFMDWSDTDSLYGARHLAEKWAADYLPTHPKRRLSPYGYTQISTIEHLILLDLLGSSQPNIQSYFIDTAWLFDQLISVENRLRDAGALNTGAMGIQNELKSFFTPRDIYRTQASGRILDDYVPFLKRGVSIIHIIANPFPQVWHSLRDDASALDVPTMRRWILILRVFMSEYLHLKPGATPSIKRLTEELVLLD